MDSIKKVKPLDIRVSGDKIRISFFNSLTYTHWGNYWGNVIEIFSSNKTAKYIDVSFAECTYAEPGVLMAIILDLLRMKASEGKEVTIILPFLFAKGDNNFKKGRFLKYLATQGFLDCFSENFKVRDEKRKIGNAEVKKFFAYNYPLPFSGDVIFPAHIYKCGSMEDRTLIIEEIMKEIQFRFKGLVPLDSYREIAEQVYNVVSELIENVGIHAYGNGEEKRFCIYIRRRNGYSFDIKDELIDADVKNEKDSNPVGDERVFIDHSLFLEIHFSDDGQGLKNSLSRYFKTQKKVYKYPLRELFYKILRDGMRNDESRALTPYGGLHYICRIISQNKGYIFCNEGKEWVSAAASELINDEHKHRAKGVALNKYSNIYPDGLNWCFRIPYDYIHQNNINYAYSWMQSFESHPVLKAYQNYDNSMDLNNLLVIDERNRKIIICNGKYLDWISVDINKILDIPIITEEFVCVWFPEGDYTKNEIGEKINYYAQIIDRIAGTSIKRVSFVIADVDSNRMYGYCYTIDGLSEIKCGKGIIDNIIVVSKRWDVACLEVSDGIFTRNRSVEEKYYSNTISTYINKSIVGYALFLRKYDSYIFWKLIKKHDNDKIYINALVDWDKYELDGYLDIERACLYSDLYRVIENAVMRTLGFANNAGVEYVSVDQTAIRVCQNINAKKNADVDNVVICNVCGASVTGYSMQAAYKSPKPSFNLNLFLHPSINSNIKKQTACLFIWPGKSFFNSFAKDEHRYFRLGKTSLISYNYGERLIEQEKKSEGIISSKSAKYADFQMNPPRLIKYGHYRSDNHHYLMGFDYMTYADYFYKNKCGFIAFILWKIIYYLCGEDIHENLNVITDSEWIKVVRDGKFIKDSNHGEIVLYHSNTATEYIINKIKKLLIPEIAEKIIPVCFYSVQAKGSPMAISPFVMKQIEDIFKYNEKKKGILFFDSSLYTGRSMLEIENILLSTGCKKVTFFSISDMRRLRIRDTKTLSYWKINIPRLDDNGRCVICDTLKIAEDYRKKVSSDYSKRILEWIRNWNCMNINNAVFGHGIDTNDSIRFVFNVKNDSKGSKNSKDEVKLPICDSTTLNAFLAEEICESYNNDWVFHLIYSKANLTAELKIQLICTQLLLFGRQNSRQIHLSLLCELVGYITKVGEENAYTSLAAMTIMSQEKDVIYELLSGILNNSNGKTEPIKKSMLESDNIDLVLTISYFMKSSSAVEQILNLFVRRNKCKSVFVDKLNEIAVPKGELKSALKEFEGLYINELGSRHNTNRQKFIVDHSTRLEDFISRSSMVINEITRLCELVDGFPISLANSRIKDFQEYPKGNELIDKLKRCVSERIYEYKERAEKGESIERFEVNERIRAAIKSCETVFDSAMCNYFITYSDGVNGYFSCLVENVKRKYSKNVSLSIECDEKTKEMHKYYYWHQGIEKEFLFFLDNLEHCDQELGNDGEESDPVYMKVKVFFGLNELLITLSSISDKMAEQVKAKFLVKNRPSKEQSLACDVIFDFEHRSTEYEGMFYLTAKMSVPACIESLKGVR